MKLSELTSRPLQDALQNMELAETKFHTMEDGTVISVELKYVPKDRTNPANAGYNARR